MEGKPPGGPRRYRPKQRTDGNQPSPPSSKPKPRPAAQQPRAASGSNGAGQSYQKRPSGQNNDNSPGPEKNNQQNNRYPFKGKPNNNNKKEGKGKEKKERSGDPAPKETRRPKGPWRASNGGSTPRSDNNNNRKNDNNFRTYPHGHGNKKGDEKDSKGQDRTPRMDRYPGSARKGKSHEWRPFQREEEALRWVEKIVSQRRAGESLVEALLLYGKEPWVSAFSIASRFDIVEKFVEIFGSAELYQTTLEYKVVEILNVMSNGRFVSQLPKYIRMACKSVPQFTCLIQLFEKLQFHLPETTLPLTDLEKCLESCKEDSYLPLIGRVKELLEIQNTIERGGSHPLHENNAILPPLEDEADLPNFRTISIVPKSEDLLGMRDPYLRKNEVNRPWPSGRLYLDTHFRLSREDFVAGLRKGIREFLGTDDIRHRNDDVYIYQQVQAVGAAFPQRGTKPFIWLLFTIPHMDTKSIQWEYSKRFLNESLLCLSPQGAKDPFTTCVFATVAERSLPDLKRGRVGVRFVDADQLKRFDWDKKYDMVENTCFFGAVSPVLTALQAKQDDQIPFGQIMLGGQMDNEPPAYLRGGLLNLSCLYPTLRQRNAPPIKLRCNDAWPVLSEEEEKKGKERKRSPEATPDPSQMRAIQHILSNKVAIVQGPPGTGKSFIGIKAVRIMVERLNEINGGPVLVVCYTNHALDQFLEDLLPHIPTLIRIGGKSRSENQRLLERNIHNMPLEYGKVLRQDVFKLRGRVAKKKKQLEGFAREYELLMRDEKDFKPHAPLSMLFRYPPQILQPLSVSHGVACWVAGREKAVVKEQEEEQKRKWEEMRRNEVALSNPYDALQEGSEEEDEELAEEEARLHEEREKEFQELRRKYQGPDDESVGPASANEVRNKIEEDRLIREEQDREYQEALAFDQAKEREKAEQERLEKERKQEKEERIAALEALNAETPEARRKRMLEALESRAEQAGEKDIYDEVAIMQDNRENVLNMDDDLLEPEPAKQDIQKKESKGKEKETQVDEWETASRKKGKEKEKEKEKEEERVEYNFSPIDYKYTFTQEDREDLVVNCYGDLLDAIDKYDGLWRIPVKQRRGLLRNVMEKQRFIVKGLLDKVLVKSQRLAERYEQIKQQSWLMMLAKSPLVGMTSTQAAKLSPMLRTLAPKVVVIEEAAELQEAQVLSCLSERTEHLVMIGDHQQLRPKINNYELERKFDFHISMFERLINLKVSLQSLETQLRMRPQISALTKLFYTVDLKDHPIVQNFPHVKGVGKDVYFLTHSVHEKRTHADSTAKVNEFEASFAVKFTIFLCQQGYQPGEVTILTPYLGQRRRVKELVDSDQYFAKRAKPIVVTVDDYQGEENKIVILSLVRSNQKDNIGFLKVVNRLIVSISRAKEGFFILGNGEMMKKNDHWFKVIAALKKDDCYGEELPLFCQNHPEYKRTVKRAEDFLDWPHGGCKKKCEAQLECGHQCPLTCHPSPHEDIVCNKPCAKARDCGHQCFKKCFQDCGPCNIPVQKTLACRHVLTMPCHTDPTKFSCTARCTRVLSCGHQCKAKCGQPCPPCSFQLKKTMPCGHEQTYKCSKPPTTCKTPCTAILPCKHQCPGTCNTCKDSQKHLPCKLPCPNELLCGHPCQEACGQFCYMKPCPEPCKNRCVHLTCRRKCGEVCLPCKEACAWKCEHLKCSKLCSEMCDRPPCNQRCKKKLPCKHRCRGLCGENCPKLCPECFPDEEDPISLDKFSELPPKDLLYQLPDCGHIFTVATLDEWMFRTDTNTKDGHVAIQPKPCPYCKTKIRSCFRYGNVVRAQLQHVEEAKKMLERKREEYDEALKKKVREEVLQAMSAELGGLSTGHWFVCPNGHPYAIGECGGAMQISRCADCGAEIGGQRHALLPGNRHSDIDGSNRSAYPT